jgi:hypothetical protein
LVEPPDPVSSHLSLEEAKSMFDKRARRRVSLGSILGVVALLAVTLRIVVPYLTDDAARYHKGVAGFVSGNSASCVKCHNAAPVVTSRKAAIVLAASDEEPACASMWRQKGMTVQDCTVCHRETSRVSARPGVH